MKLDIRTIDLPKIKRKAEALGIDPFTFLQGVVDLVEEDAPSARVMSQPHPDVGGRPVRPREQEAGPHLEPQM